MARESKKVLRKTTDFMAIKGKVASIMNTENSYYVSSMNSVKRRHLLDMDKYSTYGLSSAGSKIGFPPQFIERYGEKRPEGAKKILTDLYGDTIAKMTDEKNTRGAKKLFVRDFYDKHYALLTDRYAVFDDNEIVDFLQQNEYLMNAEEFWYSISPERFHVRFISKNKLYVDGDPSPLSMCVFVDNSMCGMSAFRIRFGIYRWACTNGMISGPKEFEIVREMHKGKKEYVEIVAKALEDVPKYEQMLLNMVKKASTTEASIYNLDNEKAKVYLQKKLSVGREAADKILTSFKLYGGKSKWDLTNAITDYAHNVNLDDRINLETKALMVA